jgi:hypothetical protein
VNGLTLAAPFGGGGTSTLTYDIANQDEMQVLISGGLGEAETGGPSINMVPKSGGNTFAGSALYSTAGDWSADNLDDRLRSFGTCASRRSSASADAAPTSASISTTCSTRTSRPRISTRTSAAPTAKPGCAGPALPPRASRVST